MAKSKEQEIASIEFDPKIQNDTFYPLLYDTSNILGLKGGGGSGKSEFIAFKWVYRMLKEKNHRVPLVRKVGKTIRDSQFRLLKDVINRYNLGHLFIIKETDMRIICPTTNSEMFALGMDDKEKVKSLAGLTGAWLEEVTELAYLEYQQMLIRVRGRLPEGCLYKQIVVTFNPIDEGHWIKEELFPQPIDQLLNDKFNWRLKQREKQPKAWIDFKLKQVTAKMIRRVVIQGEIVERSYTLHHSNYTDNRFLQPEDKALLEDLITKDFNYYRIYCLGEWGNLGNLVFNPQWRILTDEEFPAWEDMDYSVYGMDFGFHHPFALVRVGFKEKDIYVKEVACLTKMTNPEIIEYVTSNGLIEDMDTEIYADSASPDKIKEWEDAGYFVVPALKGNDSVMTGLDYLKSLNVYSHIDNVNLNREQRTYKWKEDGDGNPIEGKVVPLNDDCIDATRYAVWTDHSRPKIHTAFIGRT